MTNLSMVKGFASTTPHLQEDAGESAIEGVAHLDELAHVVAAKGLASPATFPVAKLDAARVLAGALIAILEADSESDLRRGPKIRIRDEVQRFEANLIRSALRYTGGRQRRAARLLGMNVSTLNSRIKRYRLNSAEIGVG